MFLGAVSLDAARRAGDAGGGIKGEGVFDGQGKITVAAGRDRSRRVDGFHRLIIARRLSAQRWLSPRSASPS